MYIYMTKGQQEWFEELVTDLEELCKDNITIGQKRHLALKCLKTGKALRGCLCVQYCQPANVPQPNTKALRDLDELVKMTGVPVQDDTYGRCTMYPHKAIDLAERIERALGGDIGEEGR